MKLYKNLVEAVILSLQKIFLEKIKADKVVDQVLSSNKKWGSRDRKFVAKYIYESVRWYRLYYEIGLNSTEPETEADWWNFIGTAFILNGIELPDWAEFNSIDKAKIISRNSELHTKRVVYSSIPDWLDQLGLEQFGEKLWTETIESLNQPSKVVIRVNSLKTSRSKLLDQLKRIGIEASILGDDQAIVLEEAKNLLQLDLYQDGLFEIQDFSSQQVVPFLNPAKGSIVIDACAGAGGKSLHLAAWMQNRGFIKSMDVEEYKLKELSKRAKRAAANIITTKIIGQKAEIAESWQAQGDYLLLDVPCSGTGVIRRNPDAKWKLSLDFIKELIQKQRQIIREYSKMLKKEGIMLYVTCSILKNENEEQVEWFLNSTEEGKKFVLLGEKRIMPQDQGFDGFYMAMFKKME
jgi:16S rRNA (cytosine967-C5)-methyltransferase